MFKPTCSAENNQPGALVDVFSFGVMLLELLAGDGADLLAPFGSKCSSGCLHQRLRPASLWADLTGTDFAGDEAVQVALEEAILRDLYTCSVETSAVRVHFAKNPMYGRGQQARILLRCALAAEHTVFDNVQGLKELFSKTGLRMALRAVCLLLLTLLATLHSNCHSKQPDCIYTPLENQVHAMTCPS
jgi:hypothetical protein